MLKKAPTETEQNYQRLFDGFLVRDITPEAFVAQFMRHWRSDQDLSTRHDPAVQALLDQVFVSCDQYEAQPDGPCEIDAQQLRQAITLQRQRWLGP